MTEKEGKTEAVKVITTRNTYTSTEKKRWNQRQVSHCERKRRKTKTKLYCLKRIPSARKKKTKKKQSDEWDDVCDVTSLSYSLLSLHE